jgi:nitrate reductase NapE
MLALPLVEEQRRGPSVEIDQRHHYVENSHRGCKRGHSRRGEKGLYVSSDVSKPDGSRTASPDASDTRKAELRSFLFLTVVMAPVLTVMIVGGYGFLVWMYQLVNGPPAY